MREFFNGQAIKADLLAVWLEKHGIPAVVEPAAGEAGDPDDLGRDMRVLVPETDYERARSLFFTEREDEL